jgi:dimethylamine/trimethylamine dehydrogenase
VHIAEASRELGGRVSRESRLFGLSEWARVRDWRVTQLNKMNNVTIYRESPMTAENILELGMPRIVLATGARWRRDGFGRNNHKALQFAGDARVFTPDDVMDGTSIEGPVIVFDDDDFYMGGVVAETLVARGARNVTLVTPNALASAWTANTLEQVKIQRRLLESGIEIVANTNLRRVDAGSVELACVFTGRTFERPVQSVVLVTARLPEVTLYNELCSLVDARPDCGITSISRIGDCIIPGTIASAVFDGRRQAEEMDAAFDGLLRLKTEPVEIRNTTQFHARHDARITNSLMKAPELT